MIVLGTAAKVVDGDDQYDAFVELLTGKLSEAEIEERYLRLARLITSGGSATGQRTTTCRTGRPTASAYPIPAA